MQLLAPLTLLLALPLLHACGGSFGNEGHVRLVNATSNYLALDLYAGDDRIIAGVTPASGSGYVDQDEGSVTLNLKNGDSSTTLVSLATDIAAEKHQAVLAYVTGGTLGAVVLDEEEGAPDAGYGKLRVLNAASSELAGADVYLVAKPCNTLDDTDVPAFQNVADISTAGFNQVPAGSWRICVTANGDSTDLRYEIPALALDNQQIVTLVLTRSSGGVLLDGLLVNQQGGVVAAANPYARVRLVADASGGAGVSASVNGTTLAANTTSPTVGAYRLVAAGDLATTLAIDGSTVAVTGLSAAAGTDATLLVAGSAASPGVTLLNDPNLPSTSSSKPVRIRLVNGLNGTSGTMMMTVDGDVVADSVAFGGASGSVSVEASSASSTIEVSQAGSVLKTLTEQTLAATRVYTLFLLGDAGGTVTGVLRADR